MRGQRIARWLPLTGAAFAVLLFASFLVSGETPDPDASAQEVVSFYTDNDTEQIVAAALGAYAALFLLFFAAFWRATLRRGEETGILSAVSFAGAIVLVVGGLIFSGITWTLGDVADNLDPSSVQALNALSSDFFPPLAVGSGTFMLASGMAIVRRGVVPVWLGWVAIVLGVAQVTPLGFFSFLAVMLWILVVSILLTVRVGRQTG